VTRPLVVAHHLPPALVAPIEAGLPDGVTLVATPSGQPWETGPAEVLIGFAAALRDADDAARSRPADWPGRLHWLHLRTTGIDEFPCWIMDVPILTVTRGAPAVAIAEFVLAAMLGVAKRMPELWIHDAAQWQPRALGTLEGATLGLVGFGHVGRAIAARALAFGMRVLGARRSAEPSPIEQVQLAPLATVLGEADHLVIAAPLTPATHGLIGAAAFARMKPGVHIVNVARGAIIDHAALCDALDSGRVGMATLDVTDPEPLPPGHALYTHARVRLSPHVSYSAPGNAARGAEAFLGNLRCYLDQRPEAMQGHVDRETRY
jgi:phosphoglycerate dehydrogenase-like enzyme